MEMFDGMKVKREDLIYFCRQAMCKCGFSEQDAETTAEVLTDTDAFGIYSHGTKNLWNYIRKVKAGGIDPKAVPAVISEGNVWAMVDAKNAMGMVSSVYAMKLAVKKAEDSCFGFVGVKNASHFGAAGYYANMAARQGMLGIAMSNTDPNMTVPCGKGAIIGNSPFAYAVPAGNEETIMLDIAMSTVAGLKVVQAKKDGKKIPDTWLADQDGLPTTDPGLYPGKGALLPMAAHKGYGLSLLVEILTGVLTGGGITKEVKSWAFDLNERNNCCNTFIAMNLAEMSDVGAFKSRTDKLIKEIKNSPKAKGFENILIPGEMENNRYQNALRSGIPLPDDVYESLHEIEKNMDLKLKTVGN